MAAAPLPASSSGALRAVTALTLIAGAYLAATITCAGLSLSLGPVRVNTVKLINPAMAFLLLLLARAWMTRAAAPEPPPAGREPMRRTLATVALVWLVVLVPIAVVAWGRCLDGGFIREDFYRLEAVRGGAPFNGALFADGSFLSFYSRQVSMVLDALTLSTSGLDPFAWHVVNLALHLAVALATGVLATLLLGTARAGVLASGLFALCPMAVEPVAWIAARDDSMAALMATLSAIALVLAVQRRSGWWLSASAAAVLLALFSKESALSLAGALLPIAWLADPDRESPARVRLARAAFRVIPHLAVLAVYLALRMMRQQAGAWDPGTNLTDWQKIAIMPLSPVTPLAFPVNVLSLEDLAPIARALIALALCGSAALALSSWRVLVRERTLALYAWLLLLSVPVYRMIHLSATLQNNRYLYLPGVAFTILLAHLLLEATAALPATRIGRLVRLTPLFLFGAFFGLARVNAEPWVAMGAVATRLVTHLGVLAGPLTEGKVVRLRDLPDQYRGAYLFYLSDCSWPLRAYHGVPERARFQLVELYHANHPQPARKPGELEFRWDPERGLVPVEPQD